jgi:RNA polymerase sigma-70 factor, ECF subfamily
MEDDNSRALVERCLLGENDAFGILVTQYQFAMYNTVLRIVGDPDEARDVTQAAFIKAWEKLSSYNSEHRFFSWLYRIMINEALNSVRSAKVRSELKPDVVYVAPADEDMIRQEESDGVSKAIGQLSPDYKAVILMRHFEDLSYREMASILEVDEKTVKSRLYSARMKLRELLVANR